MVDRELTSRLLVVLTDNLSSLRRYRASQSREAFVADADRQNMVEFALYKAIQACVDLALHWCSDAGLPSAESYADAFLRLGDAGLIPADAASRLAGWAGLRNVLARLYAQVDAGRIYDALDELGDLEAFASAVAAS